MRRLLAELEDDLRDRNEWTDVSELVTRLFARGTSAARQRETWLQTGDRREVAARMVREGAPLELTTNRGAHARERRRFLYPGDVSEEDAHLGAPTSTCPCLAHAE